MISIIIPVYNSAKYLDSCILSITKQQFEEWEIFLIDDGSKDGSSEKCDAWVSEDFRIKTIHQQNSGVSIARNVGIECAVGDYIYFLDSDDLCFDGIFREIDDSDIILGEFDGHPHRIKSTDNPTMSFLCGDIAMCVGSFIVKRSLLLEKNIRFKSGCKYGEDLAFFVRCLMCAKSAKICPRSFMFYRQVESSAVHQFSVRRFDVFDAWLDVMNDANRIGREDVYYYLKNISLPETLVVVSRELLRTGHPVHEVLSYINSHSCMQMALEESSHNQATPSQYRYPSKFLLHIPHLYGTYVRLIYKWYDIHAFLGTLKQKVFHT